MEESFIDSSKKNASKFFSQEFFHSGIIQWSLIGSLIFNLANWIALVYFIRPVDFPIVLHYNVFFGVDMIGAWWEAFWLPAIGIGILLINGTLGYLFYQQKERVVAHLLLLASFVIHISISIAVTCLILINY